MSDFAEAEEDRSGQPVPVPELIERLLTEYNLLEPVRRHRVFTEWRDIVGPRFAARTRPSPINEGILWVRVSNSSWLHQLSFLRDQIRTSVNNHLGSPPLVKEVRLFLGRLYDDDFAPRAAARFHLHWRRRPLPPITESHLAAIEAESASIEDEELRAIVREVRRRLGQ